MYGNSLSVLIQNNNLYMTNSVLDSENGMCATHLIQVLLFFFNLN